MLVCHRCFSALRAPPASRPLISCTCSSSATLHHLIRSTLWLVLCEIVVCNMWDIAALISCLPTRDRPCLFLTCVQSLFPWITCLLSVPEPLDFSSHCQLCLFWTNLLVTRPVSAPNNDSVLPCLVKSIKGIFLGVIVSCLDPRHKFWKKAALIYTVFTVDSGLYRHEHHETNTHIVIWFKLISLRNNNDYLSVTHICTQKYKCKYLYFYCCEDFCKPTVLHSPLP